jgi:hypothetical protein
VWWYKPIIPLFGRLSQKDLEFEASLSYIVRSCPKKKKKKRLATEEKEEGKKKSNAKEIHETEQNPEILITGL